MNIAPIGANTVTAKAVTPVEPVKAETNARGEAAKAPPTVPMSRPLTAAPIAAQLAPATVRALFNEAARVGRPLQQVVTGPAPAIAPLNTGLVAAMAAQRAGRGAPAEPERPGRTERRGAKGSADPAKTVSENLSPEVVQALIQTAQKHCDDDGLLV
ncbi:MAG: hypothetical protein ABW360_17230 [Phenylobacterium sp.]